MSETPFDELVRKTEGELTSRRAAELEQELATSPSLRAEQQRVEQLVEALKQPSPGVDEVDLRAGLWSGELPARTSSRWWMGVVVGLVAAAASAVLLLAAPEEFRVKGGSGSPAAFEAFVLRGDRAVPLGQTMRADDALGFAYRNLPGSPYRALMIYAVDAKGQTFWFYPAWIDATQPPASLLIGTSTEQVELREAVRHALSPGPLVLHAVFSREPLTVLEVEAGRVPTENTASFTVGVQVLP